MTNEIPIRPHVGVFALFSAVDYKAWYALGEFVDNAVQSFLDNQAALTDIEGDEFRLSVTITADETHEGLVTIVDNAAGISGERFASAFQVASPPPDQTGLSVYGIGMKSAAAWFGEELRVVSKALGEPVQREIVFNFPSIVNDNIEFLDVNEAPAPIDAHGTRVEIRGLHHPILGRTHEKVRRHLASIYRLYMRDRRLELIYRGEPVVYEEPEVLVARYYGDPEGEPVVWRKDIDITLPSGERLHGFAGIRRTGYTNSPGFALFRQDRVITGIEDDPWRPTEIFGPANKFAAQRLFGELHLENVRVSYSKNGFVWQAAEEELITALRAVLDEPPLPLIRQATYYRARTAEKSQQEAAAKALDGAAEALASRAGDVLGHQVRDEPAAEDPSALSEKATAAARTVCLNVNDAVWTVEVQITNEEPTSNWLEIAHTQADDYRVQLRLNLAHPFSQRFGGSEPDEIEGLVRAAAALGLAVVAARAGGVQYATTVLRIFNELLSRVLSGVGPHE